MSRAKRKYYVVWVGAKPGVYGTWPEANSQVAAFPGARYKSFPTREAAERAFAKGPGGGAGGGGATASRPKTPRPRATPAAATILKPSLSVDAACSGNPGELEYQGVSTATGQRIFHRAFPVGTNNLGEFLALVHGLAWCQANDLPEMPIYSDSRIAMGWVAKKRAKTTLKRSARTAELLDMVERGEAWLAEHPYRNPILKWETKRWGEIPADFGRK